jgi:hypothetical protein
VRIRCWVHEEMGVHMMGREAWKVAVLVEGSGVLGFWVEKEKGVV